jgi:hypothetical protein
MLNLNKLLLLGFLVNLNICLLSYYRTKKAGNSIASVEIFPSNDPRFHGVKLSGKYQVLVVKDGKIVARSLRGIQEINAQRTSSAIEVGDIVQKNTYVDGSVKYFWMQFIK